MSEIERRTNGTFAKGTSGNPSGQSKALREVVLLARAHTATAIGALVEICKGPKAQEMARVKASEILLNRSWGQSAIETDFDRIDDDGPDYFVFNLAAPEHRTNLRHGDEIEGEVVGEEDTL
jgi:hypothetical protein